MTKRRILLVLLAAFLLLPACKKAVGERTNPLDPGSIKFMPVDGKREDAYGDHIAADEPYDAWAMCGGSAINLGKLYAADSGGFWHIYLEILDGMTPASGGHVIEIYLEYRDGGNDLGLWSVSNFDRPVFSGPKPDAVVRWKMIESACDLRIGDNWAEKHTLAPGEGTVFLPGGPAWGGNNENLEVMIPKDYLFGDDVESWSDEVGFFAWVYNDAWVACPFTMYEWMPQQGVFARCSSYCAPNFTVFAFKPATSN